MNKLLILLAMFAMSGCGLISLFEDSPKQEEKITMEQLDARYAAVWDSQVKAAANTGATESYLTTEEKQVLYYLNLARLQPAQFAATYLKDYEGPVGYGTTSTFAQYKASLTERLQQMPPTTALRPSRVMYELAYCHAVGTGSKGVATYDRSVSNCPSGYEAECYSTLMHNGLEVAMQLLIDDELPLLQRRDICLGNYAGVGVSCHDHTKCGRCAVLDFE